MSDKFIPAGDKPMKIVYSKHGRFELSSKAIEHYAQLQEVVCARNIAKMPGGLKVGDAESATSAFQPYPDFSNIPRNDHVLVETVEALGKAASAPDSNLVVFEIPANTMYSITNGGGNEWPCVYPTTPSCDA